MKEFLVICVTLVLCCVFVLQYTGQQVLDFKLDSLQAAINVAKAQAKLEGRFTEENLATLEAKIEQIFNIDLPSTAITATQVPQYRQDIASGAAGYDGLIKYRIEVPIDNIMAAAKFFGIDDNSTTLVIQGSVASELPKP